MRPRDLPCRSHQRDFLSDFYRLAFADIYHRAVRVKRLISIRMVYYHIFPIAVVLVYRSYSTGGKRVDIRAGIGGKIRTAVRQRLRAKKAAGSINDFIPGEEFSMFDSATQKALTLYHKELIGDRDYNRSNNGITVVILK